MNKIRDKVLSANKRVYNEEESDRIHAMVKSFKENGAERKRIDSVFSSISDPEGKLLDLGAGTGWIGAIGQKYFRTTYAVDLSYYMLKGAGGSFHKVIANVENIPFHDGVFSSIVTSGILHHLVDTDFIFFEIYRSLKDNGVLYIENEHQNNTFKGLPTLVRGYKHFFKNRKLQSDDHKLAEFHRGLNLEFVMEKLRKHNFKVIRLGFHWYDDDDKWIARLMNFFARKINHRFGYCFFIVATK